MSRPSRASSNRALFVVVFSTFLAAPTVGAEIFKCVAKNGSPLYQNFPCDIDSVGSLPSDRPVTQTPLIPTAAAVEKPKTTSAAKSTRAGEPRIGMTSDQVRTLLGEPEEMIDDEPADGGRVSSWRYGDGRIVRFDRGHNVSGVQR